MFLRKLKYRKSFVNSNFLLAYLLWEAGGLIIEEHNLYLSKSLIIHKEKAKEITGVGELLLLISPRIINGLKMLYQTLKRVLHLIFTKHLEVG